MVGSRSHPLYVYPSLQRWIEGLVELCFPLEYVGYVVQELEPHCCWGNPHQLTEIMETQISLVC